MKKIFLLIFAAFIFAALPAAAQYKSQEGAAPLPVPVPMPAPAVAAPAEQKKYPYKEILHPILQKFIDEGGTISYLGNENGLNGWVLEKGENVQISYTTPDGKAIIRGMLFGTAEDDFVTQKQLLRFRDLGEDRVLEALPPLLPAQAASAQNARAVTSGLQKAEQFYAEIEKAKWFAIGSEKARPIYIFVDPTCEHCHLYWKDLKPQADAGVLQLRLIPVGWKKEASGMAAALLSASNPQELWAGLVEGKKELLAKVTVTDAGRASAKANEKIMSKWRLTTNPFTVYRNTEGRVMLIRDRPENLMLVVSDLTL